MLNSIQYSNQRTIDCRYCNLDILLDKLFIVVCTNGLYFESQNALIMGLPKVSLKNKMICFGIKFVSSDQNEISEY